MGQDLLCPITPGLVEARQNGYAHSINDHHPSIQDPDCMATVATRTAACRKFEFSLEQTPASIKEIY